MACYRVPRHLPVARPVSDALASTTTKRSWLFARCLLVCPGTTRQRPAPRGRNSRQSPHGTAQTGIESTYLIAEQRDLNPRVCYPNRPPTPRGTTSCPFRYQKLILIDRSAALEPHRRQPHCS